MNATNPYAAGIAYCEGSFVPVEQARIPLLDWGFLRRMRCRIRIGVPRAVFSGSRITWSASSATGKACACNVRTIAIPSAPS